MMTAIITVLMTIPTSQLLFSSHDHFTIISITLFLSSCIIIAIIILTILYISIILTISIIPIIPIIPIIAILV